MSYFIENTDHTISLGPQAWTGLYNRLNQGQWSSIFVLTDEASLKFCYPEFKKKLQGIDLQVLSIPQGEHSKSIEWTQKLWEELSNKGGDRKSLMINLGGGVVTDLGGFVASTFRRGIDYLNIPTTLLSMVDAAIGGKTGIDLGALKNQIGVVAQPKGIYIFPEFLATLPERELTSGWMEMVKHGFISNKKYLDTCLVPPSLHNVEIAELIWESVLIKNQVVTEDPYEHGRRKTLNFGHTLGHAIESYCLDHYPKEYIKHGEAVGIGMGLALYLSHITQGFSESLLIEYRAKLKEITPSFYFDTSAQQEIISYLKHDKKNSHGRINFVLLSDIGKYVVDCQITNQEIFNAFNFWQATE
jgi:3-dehydroquinate synthase